MEKARRACASARALLELGDADGAANRAYYAMFDAARAALICKVPEAEPADASRTHSGLIAAFGLRLVKSGPVSRELGRSLNRAHELRQIADYAGMQVDISDAGRMVAHAETFVSEIDRLIASASTDEPGSLGE